MNVYKENGEYAEDYVQQLELTVAQLKADVESLHEQLREALENLKGASYESPIRQIRKEGER